MTRSRGIIVLCVTGLAVALLSPATGTAGDNLTKADARLAAEVAGYDFVSHRDYLTSSQIGACRRQSATHFNCEGQATGDDFIGCDEAAPFECHSVFHRCEFSVAVHKAGYSALGRVRDAKCTSREHPS